MDCPRCKSALTAREMEPSVVAQACAGCQGMWLVRGAFRDAAKQADEEAGWLGFELWRDPERFHGTTGELDCPSCSKKLVRLAYGDPAVHLDVCGHCEGVWLDADEFEQTLTALRGELTRMPTSELLLGAFEEAAAIAKEGGAVVAEWRHMTRVARLLELRVLTDHPQLRRLLLSVQGGKLLP